MRKGANLSTIYKTKMKGIIFDLDGVLIDSKENMSFAWSMVRRQCNINIPFENYFTEIGKPFKDILHILGIPEISFTKVEEVYDCYANASCNKITVYDGVKQTLELLKKSYLIGIVTSKPKERTDLILNQLPLFDFVSCPSDHLNGKPSPDQMLYTLKKLKLAPSDAVYVGDMETDYECANAAGVKFIHARYGYGEVKCKHKIERLLDLPKLLD